MHKKLNKSYDRNWKAPAHHGASAAGTAPFQNARRTANQSRTQRLPILVGFRTRLPGLARRRSLRFPTRVRITSGMRAGRVPIPLFGFLILVAQFVVFTPAAEAQKFRADEWITECDRAAGIGPGDCSITVPFWQNRGEPKGSFALVIMLQTGSIGIVGQPYPQRALLRIDKNPPIECKQARYCIFSGIQALAALKQLKAATLILIDVFTAAGAYKFSLTPKGYQAGIAQIRAWGYRIE